MKSKKYLQDIDEIKNLMIKSSRFISLSGMSGILAGIYALVGAAIAYMLVNPQSDGTFPQHAETIRLVLLDLFLIALLSIATAIYLTIRKAKKNNEKIWDASSKRLILNFLIPLVTGGIYILCSMGQQHYGYTAALMLIFYGLSLVNAAKYSIGDIRYLGLTEIFLGLICAFLPNYGFWFWVVGFGVMHIIYGTFMYFKHDIK